MIGEGIHEEALAHLVQLHAVLRSTLAVIMAPE